MTYDLARKILTNFSDTVTVTPKEAGKERYDFEVYKSAEEFVGVYDYPFTLDAAFALCSNCTTPWAERESEAENVKGVILNL